MTWDMVPLGEVVELQYGKALKAEHRSGGKYPVVGSGGHVGSHSTALVSEPTIVVGRKGSIGSLTYAADGCWPIDTAYFTKPRRQTDLRWLFWTMSSLGLDTMNRSAAVPGLNREDAYRALIPLPPLPEQRRIAAILDEADGVVQSRARVVATIRELRDGLYSAKFGSPRSNPQGNPLRPVAAVASTRLGKMLDARQQTGHYPVRYLRNVNVRWFELDLTDLATMDIKPSERSEYSLSPGDVLVCEGGEPGRAAIWNGEIQDVAFQKALHRVRVDRGQITPQVFVHTLRAMQETGQLADSITSATISHLTGEKLRRLRIPVPPLNDQHDFGELVNAVVESETRAKGAHLAARVMFDSLQYRAFLGAI